MDYLALEKKYHNFYAPNFMIKVGGQDLLKEHVEIFSVTVNNTLEGADDCSFSVNNPFDPDGETFRYLAEGGLFEVDEELEVLVGYGDRSQLTSIFLGIITAVDVTFPANGISQLNIKGYDKSHKLMKEQRSDNFGSSERPVSYSEVVKEIIAKENYKLGTANVVDTREQHRQLKQDRQTDYDFIKNKLAGEISFEAFVFGNDFYFRPPANDKTDVVTTLEWGKTLISFSPKVNLASQVNEVEVRGWDPSKQEPIKGTATAGDEHGRDGGRESGADKVRDTTKHMWRPVSTQKEADDLAKSVLDKLASELVTGSGECIGIPDILPGHNLELKGLGERFSRTYYIERTSHSVSTSGYKTTFNVKESTV